MRETIEILLQSGEGQYIEYKSCYDKTSISSPRPRPYKNIARDIAICLAEFANADGGTLLLGVENDGTITGSPYSANEVDRIRRIAADSWKTKIPYQIETLQKPEGNILCFSVDIQYDTFTLTDGKSPYRNGEHTMWLSATEIQALKRTKTGALVERTITNFTVSDIDQSIFQK